MMQTLLIQRHAGRAARPMRHWLLTLLALLAGTASALAQTTVTIGSTALPVVSPATSTHFYGPIYRSSVGSTNNYSRYANLYTAAELGIPSGATITQLEWLKSDGGAVTGGNNTLAVLLGNYSAATLPGSTTWGLLAAGATSVYSSSTQDVTGAAGTYLTVPATGFTYTGGSLLVLVDWVKRGTASGAVSFVTNPATGLAISYVDASAPNANTVLSDTPYGNRRPTLRITYTAGVPCTAPPTAGTAVASPASACPGNPVVLTLSGSATGAGVTYQWQSSATEAPGSYTAIAGATNSTYTTPALLQDRYYNALVTCSGQTATATATAAQVTVTRPVYATVPYTQTFEATWLSRCGISEVSDASWLSTPNTGNNSWRRDDDGASASWGFPTAGAYSPTGSTGTHSARFHASVAPAGSTGTLDLSANLSAAGSKQLTFDYINRSTQGSRLDVLLSTDGGATFGATPLLTLTTAANFTTRSLTLTTTSATAVIRFRATSDFGTNDLGLDNVQLQALAVADLAASGLATPTANQVCYSSAETVTVTVTNAGSQALSFAASPATVTAVVALPNGLTQTLTGTVTTGTLAAAVTQTVALTPALDMSAPATTSNALNIGTGPVFSTTGPATLLAATLYPVGTVTLALVNAAGTELAATPALSVSGTGATTPVSVALNLAVPGTGTGYRLVVKAYTGLTGLLAESALPAGAVFPLTSASGLLTLTGSYAAGTASTTTYNYFYGLTGGAACVSGRTAIPVSVTPLPATPTISVTGTPATGITLTSSAATGNQWYRGPQAIPGATSQTYNVLSGAVIRWW